MDPFTALGLAAAVVQFLDFGTRLVSDTHEIYSARDGATKKNEELERACTDFKILVENLQIYEDAASRNPKQIAEELALRSLALKCVGTAEQLERVLRGLRIGARGKISSFRQAIKVALGRRKVADLESQLNAYRAELVVHLTALISNQQSSVQCDLRKIQEASLAMQSSHSDKLDSIFESLEDLKLKSSLTKESPAQKGAFTPQQFKHLAKRLFDLVEAASAVSAQQTVLRSLYFKAMPVRHHTIAEAHESTFQWIFDQDSDKRDLFRPSVNVSQWLESGDGIYWVSGKPGAGKSTLMKFLTNHPRTVETLSTWSGSSGCVIAKHFFWSAGTRLQKSLEGLIRSLLYEIFRRFPDLIPIVLPNYEDIEGEFDRVSREDNRRWSLFELEQAARRLAAYPSLPTKFCFFVDGLDEYDGDHREVIKILNHLASSPHIKLCVASRPWNIFEDAYGADDNRKLYLQDLTRNDIEHYTRSKLRTHTNWRENTSADRNSQKLVSEITEKAEGVFLWVYLVVRSVLEGLTNGDNIATLRERIRQLPRDLEKFFKHMLNAVDPFYHSRMAQTFMIALKAKTPLGLMVYSLIDQCLDDDEFALRAQVKPMDKYEIYDRHKQMRRRLDGRCKGLLEVDREYPALDYLGRKVTFLHRTVRDFLLTKDMAVFLASRTKVFNPSRTIFQAHIALIKLLPVTNMKQYLNDSGLLSNIFSETLSFAYDAELESDHAEPELVDEFRYTADEILSSNNLEAPWRYSFSEFVISRGLYHYLAQRQECQAGEPEIIDGSYLHQALTESVKATDPDGPDFLRVADLFLQRGADPNNKARTNLPNDYLRNTKANKVLKKWFDSDDHEDDESGDLSIWADWFTSLCVAIPENGADPVWADRQMRTLDLLIGYGCNANVTRENTSIWGIFVSAIFDLSEQQPDNHVSELWVAMLKKLLKRGASPNAPYRESTVSKTFFTDLRRLADLDSPDLGKPEYRPPNIPPESLFLLSQIAMTLLERGAHPSCVARPEELNKIFPPRLAAPLIEHLAARQAEVTTGGYMGGLLAWIWRKD